MYIKVIIAIAKIGFMPVKASCWNGHVSGGGALKLDQKVCGGSFRRGLTSVYWERLYEGTEKWGARFQN
jgi:hypothetical protein